MKLPEDTIIAKSKLNKYLLQWRFEDDKSLFLSNAGYTIQNAEELLDDIRKQILPLDAEKFEETEYGSKFRIRGLLKGPNGNTLRIVTIWIMEENTQQTKFVTLFPDKT